MYYKILYNHNKVIRLLWTQNYKIFELKNNNFKLKMLIDLIKGLIKINKNKKI